MPSLFGDLLRDWRKTRRFSQLDLGLEIGTSARHLSFLEQGRSKPSRQMVLRLAEALQMPKSVVNDALLAAGLAPTFPSHDFGDQEIQPIRDAVDQILENHSPFPAIVLNERWNVQQANKAAVHLFGALDILNTPNLIDAFLQLCTEESPMTNWPEAAQLLMARLRAERIHHGKDDALVGLIEKMESHTGIRKHSHVNNELNQSIIPTQFAIDGKEISLFTAMTQFTTVLDVNLSNLKIELMFPSNEETKAYFQSLDHST